MQPFFAAAGEDVLGGLGRYARERGINPDNVSFSISEPVASGETLGLALRFSDGSAIGVVLTLLEAQRLVTGLEKLLRDAAGPDAGLVKLHLIRDPTGLQ